MSSLINFWPVKSFFGYVFKRSFGKFLKNNIDLNLYDFSKKKITFKQLDINTQVINDMLKDSPFRVISCTISKVQINKPSLNLLTQKINIEIANVDIIIMPLFSGKDSFTKKAGDNPNYEEDKDQIDVEKEESQKTEEFNILNNLVNKILSNLEVKLQTITVRMLTKEIIYDIEEEIPTLLLRLNNVEYKRFIEQNPDQKPVSDMQTILDGKSLDIQEVSIHFMKAPNLHPQEWDLKNNQLGRLRFPQDYPLINHPSTILVIKPILPSIQSGQQGSQKCIEVKLQFPKDKPQNKLQISANVPNIEVMAQVNQLRDTLKFILDIVNFVHENDTLKFSSDSSDLQFSQRVHVDDHFYEQYGTMIKNNQNIKEAGISPILKKAQSSKPKTQSPLMMIQKTKKKKQKMSITQEKLICKFIQKTQDKKEFQKLKEDLKKSVMQSQATEDQEALMTSQLLETSIQQTKVKQQKRPLDIGFKLELEKLSLTIICNENGVAYDNIYDCYASLHHSAQNQLMSNVGDSFVHKFDQKIAYSHYCIDLRGASFGLNFCNIRRKPNPFAKAKDQFIKKTSIELIIKTLQLNRYDLVDTPSQQTINFYQQQLQNNYTDLSLAQYESFTQNSAMFESAQEFFNLNNEQSVIIEKTQSNKRAHQQPQGQNSLNIESNLYNTSSNMLDPNTLCILNNIFRMNHFNQHFCKQSIIDVRQLIGSNGSVCQLKSEISQDEVTNKFKSKTTLDFGVVNINLGYDEFLLGQQLTKGLYVPTKAEEKAKKIHLEQFDIKIECLKLELLGPCSQNVDQRLLFGSLIENKPIEQLRQKQCFCGNQITNTLLVVLIRSPTIKVKPLSTSIKFDSLDLSTIIDNNSINLLEVHNIDINIFGQYSNSQDQKETSQIEQKTFLIVFEGQEQSDNSQMKQSSAVRQGNMKQEQIQLNIEIEKIISEIDINNYKSLIKFGVEIESAFKCISIMSDFIKCYNTEHRQQKQLKRKVIHSEIFGQKPPLPLFPIFKMDLKIQDIQLLFVDHLQEKAKCYRYKEICKLRTHNLQLKLTFHPTISKERILINLRIQDLMFLDYLQNMAEFHPMEYKRQDLQEMAFIPVQNPRDYIRTIDSTFQEELQASQPFILIYRQQGIANKYTNPQAIDITFNIAFSIAKKFEDKLTMDLIATHFVDISTNHILQLYEEINAMKKNPMNFKLTVILQGLVFRVSIEHDLIKLGIDMVERIGKYTNEIRQTPVTPVVQIVDEIGFSLQFEDIVIDYNPNVKQKIYDQIFLSDLISANLVDAKENYFKTYLRSLIYLGNLKIEIFTSKEKKENVFAFYIMNLGLSMLKNNTLQQEYNPILLLDYKQSLDQDGGQSYIDYLGFIRLLSVDRIELRYIHQYGIIIEELDSAFYPKDDESEEDYFKTTYEHNATKSLKKKQLDIIGNKFSIYLAKDSYDSIKTITKIAVMQIDDLIAKIDPKKAKKGKSKMQDFQYIDDQQAEGIAKLIEQFLVLDYDPEQDKIIYSDFANSQIHESYYEMMNKPVEVKYQDQENSIREDGYFIISSGLKEGIKRDSGFEKFNFYLNEYITDENYLPVLDEHEINSNRHKLAHVLPYKYIEFFLKIRVYLEIQSLDIKLFDGLDFDFIRTIQKPSDLRDSSLNTSAYQKISQSQMMEQRPQNVVQKIQGSLFSFDEDYIGNREKEENTIEENQSLTKSSINDIFRIKHSQPIFNKRPRKSGRGNYFTASVRFMSVSFYQMRDFSSYDPVDYYRICFSIQQCIIKESLSKQGMMIRELLQLPYAYQYDNQIEITVEYDKYDKFDEIGFKMKSQPFKLLMNQAVVTFFQKFFDIDFAKKAEEVEYQSAVMLQKSQISSALSDSQKQIKPIYIKQLKIYPFQVLLSYTSKQLNLYDLTNGNFIEFLNIFNLNDLKINIKKYDLKQRIQLEQAIQLALNYYKEDLVNNQKINFVKAIGPIRSVFNVAGAFYGVFKKPYQGYYNEKGVVKGLGEGFYGLYHVITEESTNITHKVSITSNQFYSQWWEFKKQGIRRGDEEYIEMEYYFKNR